MRTKTNHRARPCPLRGSIAVGRFASIHYSVSWNSGAVRYADSDLKSFLAKQLPRSNQRLHRLAYWHRRRKNREVVAKSLAGYLIVPSERNETGAFAAAPRVWLVENGGKHIRTLEG